MGAFLFLFSIHEDRPKRSLKCFMKFESVSRVTKYFVNRDTASNGKWCCTKKGNYIILVGWLFWAERPFETILQSMSGRLPEGGRKNREVTVIDERKMFTYPCPAPSASTDGLCLLLSKLAGRPALEVLPSIIAPSDHPLNYQEPIKLNFTFHFSFFIKGFRLFFYHKFVWDLIS